MVSVSDEHGLGTHQTSHGRDGGDVAHRPQPMDHAQVIDGFQRRDARRGLLEPILDFIFRIGIEAEYLAEVCLARSGEQQPVRLGAGHGLFVRIDLALAEALQPAACHEAAPGDGLAVEREHLVIDVDGCLGLAEQHTLVAPIAQKLGRAAVAIAVLVVAGLFAIEDQSHYVGGVLLVELLLQRRADHVVRRRHHVAQRADMAQVVTKSAEGLDVRHWE